MITERDLLLAWVAGIMDGEGSFLLNSNGSERNGVSLCLSLQMTDKETVERVCRIIGIGCVIKLRLRNLKHKPLYKWALSTQNAIDAIRMFRPYLFLKDQQADILIRYMEEVHCEYGKKPTVDQVYLRNFLLQEIRKLNQRGSLKEDSDQ